MLVDEIRIYDYLTEEQVEKLPDAFFDEMPYLLIGGGAIVIGSFLIIDDIADFGKFNFGWSPLWKKEHESWFHHWQWGVIILVFGLILFLIGIWKILKDIGWSPSQLHL